MHSTLRQAQRRSKFKPLAAALAASGFAGLAAMDPALAQPTTGEALGEGAITACTGLAWAEMQAAFGGDVPKVTACRETVHTAFQAAIALTVADQEQLALAFTELLREPVEAGAPAPFPAVSYVLTTRYEGWVATYCTPAAVAPWGLGTLEACTAAIRMVVIGSQALSPDIASMTPNTICSGLLNALADWRTAAFAIIDELAARAATGTDPVMQVRIDEMATGITMCR